MATKKTDDANERANGLMVHPVNPDNKAPTTRRAFEKIWKDKGWKLIEGSKVPDPDTDKGADSKTK